MIATKAGLVRGVRGDWKPNGHPDHLRETVHGSLSRLGVERIDLLQLHRPDPAVPFEDSLGALVELRDHGKIRHIGVSNVSVELLDRAQALTEIVSVQNRFNLTDRAHEDVLDACTQRALAFIPWRPLATGDLTAPGGPLARIATRHEGAARIALTDGDMAEPA